MTFNSLLGAFSEIQGHIVGSGQKKVRGKRKTPGDKVSPDQLQTAQPVLAPDWAEINFCIFLPNEISESVSCVLTRSSTRGLILR